MRMSARSAALISLLAAIALATAPVMAAAVYVAKDSDAPAIVQEPATLGAPSATAPDAAATAPSALGTGPPRPKSADEISEKVSDRVRYPTGDSARVGRGAVESRPIVSAPDAPAPSMGAPPAPQWSLGNVSHNGTVGSTSWSYSNWTLTVGAGNLSWRGINCSWTGFTWSKGQDLVALLNLTCDFWGLFTVTFQNGTANVTWSNGSWDHTFGAPPIPKEFDGALVGGILSDPSVKVASTAPPPVKYPTVPAIRF